MEPRRETAQRLLERLQRPAEEMRFLLDRGYRRAHALRVVGEHHQLPARERNVLERVVFPADEADRRRRRLIEPAAARDQTIIVDGYNVLVGVDCLLTGAPLFLADDGLVRDIATRRGLRSMTRTRGALSRLVQTLARLEPAAVDLVLDQQVSRSGELANVCRDALGSVGLAGDARTETRADRAIIVAAREAIAASSDRVIVDAAAATIDLVGAAGADRSLSSFLAPSGRPG